MIHKIKSRHIKIAGLAALEACLLATIGIAVSGAGVPTLSSDAEFAKKAAQGGVLEVKLGQLAQQKGESDAVKDFGRRMENDHSKAGDNLKQVASQEQLPLPTDLDKTGQMEYDKLSKLSGADFDRSYTKMMIQDHQKDVAEFQKEARNGQDDGIKNFAAQTLPTIQEHLLLIQKIQKDMLSSRNSSGM